jgi:ketosteroid isomerase-like protein
MFGRSRKERAKRLIAAICGCDHDAVMALVTDDIVLVDSLSFRVSGRDRFSELFRDFCALDLDLRITHGELGVSGDQILMTGDQTARDETFNARVQWQISFRGNQICRIQTFRGRGAPSIINLLRTPDERQELPPLPAERIARVGES